MLNRKTINSLTRIVGPGQLTTAPEDLLCYGYDASAMEYLPEAVAFPGCVEEISSIMRLASATPFPVVPRGAGSGVTGGALPVNGGLVLAMSRLNRILDIDSVNQVAVVEPGVITGRFQEEVQRLGLFYPPDPASLKFCTLGGNVAECAGGPSAVKYGVTRDYILGLEVVLADGRVLKTGVRTAKGVAGYDLTRLFIGSEGTLGIITKIILKLLARPKARITFLVLTRSLDQAARLVSRILSAGLLPCTLEYMDKTAIHIVSGDLASPLPEETEALLLLEIDGDEQVLDLERIKLMNFLEEEGDLLTVKQAADQEEIDSLWAARRAISPASYKLKSKKINEDVVVPRSRIPDLVAFTESLALELGLIIFTFGHAGDGNIHVNIMVDAHDPDEIERGRRAKERLFKKVLSLNGTITGEHGIGLTKADYLPMELDNHSLMLMRQIKNLFDPLNILNPGKIFLQPCRNTV